MNRPTLLIDADILLYRAASSVERELKFEDNIWILYTDEDEAVEAFKTAVGELLSQADTYSFLLCFSHNENFRKDLYPTYKGNRTQRKPMGFKAIRERVISDKLAKVRIFPRIEADDVIGILATSLENTLIWSADKDLKQIPGKHLVDGEIITITQEEGDYWHLTQTLTGDATDGYPGCPGIGPRRAEIILSKPVWSSVVGAYAKQGYDEDYALTQARLARILRAEDWDFVKEEVRLWQPANGSSSLETASAA